MESVAISLGSIILLGITLYFAIKSGVRNGINESMPLTVKQKKNRKKKNKAEYDELVECYKNAGEEVPDFLKEHYSQE